MAELKDKRKPRLIPKEEQKSKRPNTTQKGKSRKTSREQALELNAERLQRVVNKITKTKAEDNLQKLSMKMLKGLATDLGVGGMANLRKNDIIILIVREYEGRK